MRSGRAVGLITLELRQNAVTMVHYMQRLVRAGCTAPHYHTTRLCAGLPH